MKRIIYTLLFILPLTLNSQNMYNITNLLDNDPAGTARFVGMGGSMSALGGNLSVMGTNPAGTAVYRSNDFYISGAYDIVNSNATFMGNMEKKSYDGTELSNVGFLLANEIEASPLKFVNFGINYRRKGNMRGNFNMSGNPDGFSQQYIINDLYMSSPFDINGITADSYSSFNHNWLALLAADVDICDADSNFLVFPSGHPLEEEVVYYPNYAGYYSEQRGGVNVTDINLSFNIEDRVYIGATLGFHIVDYSRYSRYYESDDYGYIYTLENDYSVSGSGVDFKLGAIVRPFKYSPFKVAFSVHTPVSYSLTDYSSATMIGPGGSEFSTLNEDCYGESLRIAYRLKTPWRFGAAASYTFGNFLALNAEYEYSNLTKTSFSDRTDMGVAQNEEIMYNLKLQHTLRAGAEFNIKKVALRAGYNYISAPFNKDACKFMDNAAITDTSTDYMNKYSKNIATLGLGYAAKSFYFDIAYMFQTQKADFYPYYDMEVYNPGASVRSNAHTVVAGIGVRF